MLLKPVRFVMGIKEWESICSTCKEEREKKDDGEDDN